MTQMRLWGTRTMNDHDIRKGSKLPEMSFEPNFFLFPISF